MGIGTYLEFRDVVKRAESFVASLCDEPEVDEGMRIVPRGPQPDGIMFDLRWSNSPNALDVRWCLPYDENAWAFERRKLMYIFRWFHEKYDEMKSDELMVEVEG